MKDETLLPCPFCGGVPEEDAYGCIEYGGHEHQDYTITCKSCGAEVSCITGVHDGADVECSCHHDTRKICVDKWNKRTANSPAIPDGWKLVPIEPTADMSHAGHDYYQKSKAEFGDFTPTGMYRAMLSAVPQPPVSTSVWIKCSDRKPEQRNYISAVSHYGEYVSGLVNGEWLDLHDGSTFAIADIYLWLLLPEIPAAPKPEGE